MPEKTPDKNPESREMTIKEYLAIALAWLIPGAGHLLGGHKARGIIFTITIHGLFAAGLLIGGLKSLNPADQPIWSKIQYLAGWPMIAASHIQQNTIPTKDYAPATQEVGTVYCGIAGMLNLLVVFDAMLRLTGARGTTNNATSATPPATASTPKSEGQA